jgi:hypothetical protein
LKQMPAISHAKQLRLPPKLASHPHIMAEGDFVGLARWLVAPRANLDHNVNFGPARPGHGGDDPGASNIALGAILHAIAEDVKHLLAAVRAGIIAEFTARATVARRHLPRDQIAAALQILAQMRRAALALAEQNAKLEMSARRETALAAYRQAARPKSPRNRGPQTPEHL